MAKHTEYDKTDIASIFEYSKGLLGHALRDFMDANPDELRLHGQGKGGLGQMVEKYYFHYDVNNDPGPDFSEAGLELKATGLIRRSDNELHIKERLVCDIINYCHVVDEDFESSLFYLKCRIMLLLFYIYQKNVSKWDLKFIYSVIWQLPEKDLLIIKHDYETIVGKVRSGEAHLLSEGDTEYLGACRKGQKGTDTTRQPYSDIPAPTRAFCLKTAYMRTVLEWVKGTGQNACSNIEIKAVGSSLFTTNELRDNDFETLLLRRFKPWIGKTVGEMASHYAPNLNLRSKDIAYVVSCMVASDGKLNGRGHQRIEQTDEFKKSGIRFKTIPTYANGRVKEAMSFENINYDEIYQNDSWEDSTTYELFTSRFLFLVFRHPTITSGGFDYEYGQLVLDKVFFWTMPQQDLVVAREFWQDIRNHVLNNEIGLQNFWKPGWSQRNQKHFHVRPKGQKGHYKGAANNPNGGKADTLCYWFNQQYVTDIIHDNERD